MEYIRIVDSNSENIGTIAMCGYKNEKQEGYKRKVEWIKKRYKEGLLYKFLVSDKNEAVGGIEYIPGEYTWRAVEAKDYMMVHCIYIMKKAYKNKGYGELMLKECIKDAKKNKMLGVAVIVRKGTWMAGKELFLKSGFESIDTAPPDFELMVKKFKKTSPSPKFAVDWQKREKKYAKGLTLIVSDQCPYTAKAVNEITVSAENKYGISPKIVELKTAKQAQASPTAFGCFSIVHDGKVVADHPISNTRFMNIMNKVTR
jgi:L-amino acid N-acyltransferase YncA